MATYKLGKHPPQFDPRTLRFGKYLTAKLPPPPPAVDYAKAVSTWPMMGNDKYSDCTCAAAGHMIEEWTANTGAEKTLTDEQILAAYNHFAKGVADAGANMLDVLKYWRKTGIGGEKITAFTQLERQNGTEVRHAVNLFGNGYLGVALPDFAAAPGVDLLKTPWVAPAQGAVGNAAPNQKNGHCVLAVAYDSRDLYVVTWGALKSMSWQFYDAYADEAFAVLSADWISKKAGLSPSGFDMTSLMQDLAKVASAPSPVPTVA